MLQAKGLDQFHHSNEPRPHIRGQSFQFLIDSVIEGFDRPLNHGLIIA